MSVGELIEVLKQYDPALTVRVNYDRGYDYDEIVRVYLIDEPTGEDDENEISLCLDTYEHSEGDKY